MIPQVKSRQMLLNMQCCTTCFLLHHPKTQNHVARRTIWTISTALQKCSILIKFEGPNHCTVNSCHIALVICQAAATTVSVVPGTMLSSGRIFSLSLGKYGDVLLDEPSSCSRICDFDSSDLDFVCCCTGMNIRTRNYMHVYYLQCALVWNIEISLSTFTNCSDTFYPESFSRGCCDSDCPSPDEPFHTCIFLDLIWLCWTKSLHSPTLAIHHPPTSCQTYTKVTEKALSSLPDRRHCQVPLQKGPWTQYEFHCCHNIAV